MKRYGKGDAEGRYNLGCAESRKGNYHLATRHFLISAKTGHTKSLDTVRSWFTGGFVATKAQYAEALRVWRCRGRNEESRERFRENDGIHSREEARHMKNSCALKLPMYFHSTSSGVLVHPFSAFVAPSHLPSCHSVLVAPQGDLPRQSSSLHILILELDLSPVVQSEDTLHHRRD